MKAATNTLSASARSAIASAYVAGLNASENTGSLLHTVCEVGARYLKGERMQDEDTTVISADVARAKGWKGASLAARVSEVKIMLRSLHVLPDAIDAFRERAKACTWHDGMKLARKLAKGESVKKAVSMALTSNKSGERGTPEGHCAGALKRWYKVATPKKREAILNAASTLGIKLGIKLDA